MAKSLRSKTKLKAKSIKRAGVFSKVEDLRRQRIAEKLNRKDDDDMKEDKVDDKINEKPVSTSGWRGSRKQQYKKKQAAKRNKSLKF